MIYYQPEIGQLLFGNPMGGFEMPPYACSMLTGLLDNFDQVYWNQHQHEWQRDACVEIGPVYFRPYWWGDDDTPEAGLPNFGLTDDPVEIRWYKHAKRGQSVNMDLTPGQWAAWHDRVYRAMMMIEYERNRGIMTHPDECYHWHIEPIVGDKT